MKPIPGYEGRYSACEDGTIFSHISNRSLHPRPIKNGYYRVYLCNGDGHPKEFLIHRLICTVFHGANPDKDVNHIDCNKANNRPENLEWCDRKENMQHASRHGRLTKQSKRMVKINKETKSKPIIGVYSNGDTIGFASLSDAEKQGYNHSGISMCLHQKIKTYKGLQWFLAEEKGEL